MAPPQGGAFDFSNVVSRGSSVRANISAHFQIFAPITAVTLGYAFAVDLQYLKTYSQAQGEV
jgi:hypothetical protein